MEGKGNDECRRVLLIHIVCLFSLARVYITKGTVNVGQRILLILTIVSAYAYLSFSWYICRLDLTIIQGIKGKIQNVRVCFEGFK